MIKKLFFVLGLLPMFTTSLALGQATTPPPGNKGPRPVMKLEGGVEVASVKEALDMALPVDKARGIHFALSNELFLKYPDRSKMPSGLYLLDTELIPRQLPEILTRNGLALGPNGSIINQKGEKIVMLLRYKLIAVGTKHGSLPGYDRFFGLLGPTPARAATPFPLEWVSAWGSWYDNEGFCRSLTASTGADAWGPIIDQWGDRVHTSIESIETFAGAADAQDDKTCNNCPWSFSQANRDFGCFWPAHGGGEWGWADTKDGSFNWSWSW
jgi:hypothetical protein